MKGCNIYHWIKEGSNGCRLSKTCIKGDLLPLICTHSILEVKYISKASLVFVLSL
uniref:Uncharacterized protein n=1 Tax=Rhizophora mucronata TaxID=61149 RepID=A0A2P2JVJ5_RHIMU